MRVLLVEDDAGVREGLADLLRDFGTVHEAAALAEAIAALGNQPFDLVITDLHIGVDGEGGRRVAHLARDRRCRVFVMSGSTREEIERALGGWRPDGIIEKPFMLEDVIHLLEQERARIGRDG